MPAADTNWIFDWNPAEPVRVSRLVSVAICLAGAVALGLAGYWVSGTYGCLSLSLTGLIVSALVLRRLENLRATVPVRFCQLGVCMLIRGQKPLRVIRLALHPLCSVLTVQAHDPLQSRSLHQIVFWRHHHSADTYRRMTLVFRWLLRQGQS